VAVAAESSLVLLDGPVSIFALAKSAIERDAPIQVVVESRRSDETLDYDSVYYGQSEWRLLPAFDHPEDPHHCLVTGTGLTHNASAANRDKMHEAQAAGNLTDSMRMYQWGVEGGRPPEGEIGAQPEWFYKGTGAVLKAHLDPLVQPAFADDAGEEPEVAAAYIVDEHGQPWRVGVAPGNEFADHVMEKKNYLYLAHSKLRQCAIGPELVLDEPFQDVPGKVTIFRDGKVVWSAEIQSGQQHMAHSLANLEYHHFKYAQHRMPWQAHVHFFGAAAFSFGAQVQLQQGDTMEVAWHPLGRPLRNTLQIEASPAECVRCRRL
jgi:hypothetical protein